MDTFIKDSLTELECPVCFNYVIPPIFLCENGHNVCNICKPKLERCPICKGSLTNMRPISQENFLRKLPIPFPCKFKDFDCQEKLLLVDMPEHEEECVHRIYKCPVMNEECEWEGPFNFLENHLINKHSGFIIKSDAEGKFNYVCRGIDHQEIWQEIIFTLDEIFFCVAETTWDYLYFNIFYLGSKRKAKNYKYRLTFTTEDGCDTFTTCRTTPSYPNYLNMAKSENCFVLTYDFAAGFADEKNYLSIVAEIIKAC